MLEFIVFTFQGVKEAKVENNPAVAQHSGNIKTDNGSNFMKLNDGVIYAGVCWGKIILHEILTRRCKEKWGVSSLSSSCNVSVARFKSLSGINILCEHLTQNKIAQNGETVWSKLKRNCTI